MAKELAGGKGGTKGRSFWLDDAATFETLPRWSAGGDGARDGARDGSSDGLGGGFGDGPGAGGRVDVAVVGGGFTGLSTALHIKERRPGLRVVVLEAATVAGGASGRNAGFAMTLFGLELGITVLRYGKRRAKEADDYMVEAVNYTRELVRRFEIDCDYEEHGLITVATNRAQKRRLYKQYTLARRLGLYETDWLDAAAVRRYVDSPTYLAGWYDPLCALVQPAKLARGMARAAIAAGVEIYEGSPVRALHPGEPVVLEVAWSADVGARGGTRSRRIRRLVADKVVLATNAFSASWPQLRRVQAPLHTYVVLTEPLSPEQIEAIGWHKRVGVEDGRNFIHYYRLTPDNRLLMGGHDALYYYGNRTDKDHNAAVEARLQRHVVKTFPPLRGVGFTHHWGGPISVSLDMVPVIGRLGANVWYSVGCMGHGVALTQLNGRTLADLVLGIPSRWTDAFFVGRRVTPLPPEPLRFSVIQTLRGFMRLQDVWDDGRGSG